MCLHWQCDSGDSDCQSGDNSGANLLLGETYFKLWLVVYCFFYISHTSATMHHHLHSSFIIIHHHSSSVVVIRYSILFWSPSSCFLWGHTVVYYFSRRISYLSGFRMGCSLSVLSLLKPIGSGSAERSFAFDWFNFWVPEMPGNLATNAFMDRTWFDIC